MSIYRVQAAKFNPEDDVIATYNVLESKHAKMLKVFKKFKLEWEPEEAIDSDEDGNPIEWSGTLNGKYKDVVAFLKSAFGDSLKNLNSYITKV